jgi:tetratricopeptide (TPR) repeat protein
MALAYYELGDFFNAEHWLERSLDLTQNYCSRSELYRCLARSQLVQEDYESAVSSATLGIKDSGGSATGDMYAIRGAAYQSLGEYNKALGDFYAAIALGYADPHEMYKQCTLCNFLLGDYKQAVSCGERALDNSPDEDATLYYWLGVS